MEENNRETEILLSLDSAKKELKRAAGLLFAEHLDEIALNMEGNKSYETIVDMLGDLSDFIETNY